MIESKEHLEAVKIKCGMCGMLHICNITDRENCKLEWGYQSPSLARQAHAMDSRQAAK